MNIFFYRQLSRAALETCASRIVVTNSCLACRWVLNLGYVKIHKEKLDIYKSEIVRYRSKWSEKEPCNFVLCNCFNTPNKLFYFFILDEICLRIVMITIYSIAYFRVHKTGSVCINVTVRCVRATNVDVEEL